MTKEDDGWMPRLADGVPIWKMSQDLNQPELMDGALIVPETEGSPSAPRSVRWHVRNLLALSAARQTHPDEVERALATFRAATIRIELALNDPTSAYHAFRSAFTLPSLEGPHYFFDAIQCKIHVIHWGAEPRSHGSKGAVVYGFGNLAEAFEKSQHQGSGARLLPVATMTSGASSSSSERGPVSKRAPWWWGLLVVAAALTCFYFLVMKRPGNARTTLASGTSTPTTVATGLPSATVTSVKSHLGRETLVPFDKPLLFEFGSARIDAQGAATIHHAATYLSAHPEFVRVRIEGHADATGEDDKNFVLSTARALAVQRALIDAGVDAERLHIDAHGQTRPAVLDAGAALRNRRVELWGFRYDAPAPSETP